MYNMARHVNLGSLSTNSMISDDPQYIENTFSSRVMRNTPPVSPPPQPFPPRRRMNADREIELQFHW